MQNKRAPACNGEAGEGKNQRRSQAEKALERRLLTNGFRAGNSGQS
jgi:hypothetical protein